MAGDHYFVCCKMLKGTQRITVVCRILGRFSQKCLTFCRNVAFNSVKEHHSGLFSLVRALFSRKMRLKYRRETFIRSVLRFNGVLKYGVVTCAVSLAKKITTLPSFKTNLPFDSIFSKKYADSLRAKISPNKTFPPSYYGPFLDQTVSHGTTHVSVIGPDGDLASVTR